MGEEAGVAGFVRDAVAVIVATRDEQLRPEVGRAWGPSLSDDGARLTMCVEATPGSSMARNLEPGSPVAATLARLTSQTTVQVKGWVLDAGEPTANDLDAVDAHVAAFVAEAGEVGVPEAIARGLVGADLTTVTIEITEQFDDTPGARAGRPGG